MDAFTLISSTSSVSSDDDADYEEFLAGAVPPPIADALRALNEYLGDEIDFQLLQESLGLVGRISGAGLGLLVKNASKYIK
jgi:hypothetical protein